MSQQNPTNPVLSRWNSLEADVAAQTILPCNGSRAWALGIVDERSFPDPEQLFAASDVVWRKLTEADWQQAFDSHPRIGEHTAKAATQQSAAWSEDEQSSAQLDLTSEAELAKANKEYEAKFNRIFIICATGKTVAEMLNILHQRLRNTAVNELQEAAEQQRRITQLRLRKWLELPALKCEEV